MKCEMHVEPEDMSSVDRWIYTASDAIGKVYGCLIMVHSVRQCC